MQKFTPAKFSESDRSINCASANLSQLTWDGFTDQLLLGLKRPNLFLILVPSVPATHSSLTESKS